MTKTTRPILWYLPKPKSISRYRSARLTVNMLNNDCIELYQS